MRATRTREGLQGVIERGAIGGAGDAVLAGLLLGGGQRGLEGARGARLSADGG